MLGARKGFASMYGVILLSIALVFIDMLTTKIKTQQLASMDISVCEIQAIHTIKQMIAKEVEENRVYTYNNCEISIVWEFEQYTMDIKDVHGNAFKAKLQYHQNTQKIKSYEYMSEK